MTDQRVFVSHASEDALVAMRIVEALEAQGISAWIAPRDIPAGTNHLVQIPRAIPSCAALVVLVSQAILDSRYVLLELNTAFDHGVTVVPLSLDGTGLPGAGFRSLPEELRSLLSFSQVVPFNPEADVVVTVQAAIVATEPDVSSRQPRTRPDVTAIHTASAERTPAPLECDADAQGVAGIISMASGIRFLRVRNSLIQIDGGNPERPRSECPLAPAGLGAAISPTGRRAVGAGPGRVSAIVMGPAGLGLQASYPTADDESSVIAAFSRIDFLYVVRASAPGIPQLRLGSAGDDLLTWQPAPTTSSNGDTWTRGAFLNVDSFVAVDEVGRLVGLGDVADALGSCERTGWIDVDVSVGDDGTGATAFLVGLRAVAGPRCEVVVTRRTSTGWTAPIAVPVPPADRVYAARNIDPGLPFRIYLRSGDRLLAWLVGNLKEHHDRSGDSDSVEGGVGV